MKTAIVTGATGFVGFQVVKKLHENGYKVCAIVHSENGKKAELLREIAEVKCIEMCDYRTDMAIKTLEDYSQSDVFFHFAWNGSAGALRANYNSQLENVRYTCDAVRLAKKLDCHRFVSAGSIMEDECTAYVPKDGTIPSQNYHYSIAKYTAHLMAKTEAARCGIEFCWGKISNSFGETDTTQRFINSTIRKFLAGERCSFTHAEQLYDFIYITDLAKAFVLIGESGVPGSSYYIGNGCPKPLKEYILSMHEVAGSTSELGFGEIPFSGAMLSAEFFSNEKLKNDTGFCCEYTFEQGIAKTIDYLKETEKE